MGHSIISHYYSFGMLEPERNYTINSNSKYRFGFNGQEKDDEIRGNGNNIVFKFRNYDGRLGRFLSIDPLTKKYPWNSPYAFAENDVIRHIDLEGKEKGTQSGMETKWGFITAIDNTRPVLIRQDAPIKVNPPINNGEINAFSPGIVERIKNKIEEPSHDGFELSGKLALRLIYHVFDDGSKIGTSVAFGPSNARDLTSVGASPQEIQDAGINTFSLIMPVEGMVKTFGAGEQLGMKEFLQKYKGTDVLKGGLKKSAPIRNVVNAISKESEKAAEAAGETIHASHALPMVKHNESEKKEHSTSVQK
jgi:RHS repeat-associated protein